MVEATFRLSQLKGISTSRRRIKNLFNSRKEWTEVLNLLNIPLNKDVQKQYIYLFMDVHRLNRLQPGVKNVLKIFQRKFRLFVVTSRWYRTRVENELKERGIRRYFNDVVTRQVAAEYFGLPSLPLQPFRHQREIIYKCALGLAGLLPKQVAVVGDSPRELEPAKGLGMKVIAVLTGTSSKEELEKVTPHVIATLNELDKLDVFK